MPRDRCAPQLPGYPRGRSGPTVAVCPRRRQVGQQDTPAPRPHLLGPDHRVQRVVGALHQHVRVQRLDQCRRRVLVEHGDQINARRPRQHRGAASVHLAASPPSAGACRRRRSAHHQPFAGIARGLQQVHVPRVQHVEAAIGDTHPVALVAPALHLLQRGPAGDDLAQRPTLRRQCGEQVGLAAPPRCRPCPPRYPRRGWPAALPTAGRSSPRGRRPAPR